MSTYRPFETASYSYSQGYRNGRLDARQGVRLLTALLSDDRDYARGYAEGQSGASRDVYDEGGEA